MAAQWPIRAKHGGFICHGSMSKMVLKYEVFAADQRGKLTAANIDMG